MPFFWRGCVGGVSMATVRNCVHRGIQLTFKGGGGGGGGGEI